MVKWRAYCFDMACIGFGTEFQSMLEEITGDNQRQTERRRIKLMQKVLGKENSPKLEYRSVRGALKDRGVDQPTHTSYQRGRDSRVKVSEAE